MTISWTPITIELAALKPWERNPKTISKAHAKRLLANWQDLGQWQTIAIGTNGEVYDGHQRLSVLKAVYGDSYQVKALQSSRPLTDDERGRIAFEGTIGAVGQIDWEQVSSFDADALKGWGLDDSTLGDWKRDTAALDNFLKSESGEPVDAEPQIDRAAELQEKWQVKRGDLWQIGDHRLLCGDSTVRADVDKVMGGERADLVFTDPPYGVDYEGGANNEKKREKLAGDDTGDLYMPVLKMCKESVKKSAPMYVWFAASVGKPVYDAVSAIGYEVRAMIIWNKLDAHYGAFMAQYMQKHESCLYIVDGNSNFIGASNEVTVWDLKQPAKNELHPTQKPIELALRAIGNHAAPIVIDFCAGSGTTGIACQNLGRRARMIEISEAYTAVILQRFSDAFPGIDIRKVE